MEKRRQLWWLKSGILFHDVLSVKEEALRGQCDTAAKEQADAAMEREDAALEGETSVTPPHWPHWSARTAAGERTTTAEETRVLV
jgi:hypothetical protein